MIAPTMAMQSIDAIVDIIMTFDVAISGCLTYNVTCPRNVREKLRATVLIDACFRGMPTIAIHVRG